MKNKAIVIDIDGVILNTEDILKEILRQKLKGDEMWEYFYENCNSSRIPLIKNIVQFLGCLSSSIYIILSTARNERCRKGTEEKLTFNRRGSTCTAGVLLYPGGEVAHF